MKLFELSVTLNNFCQKSQINIVLIYILRFHDQLKL
jgi:hypothetical protein